MKLGLVLEGGGARCAYTAGALEWLMDQKIHFEYGVGNSICGLYLFCFLTENRELLKEVSTKIAMGKGTVGLPALLREGTLVGYNRMFEKVVASKHPLDMEKVHALKNLAEVGVYDLKKGDSVWMNQKTLDDHLYYLKGASTIPIFGKEVEIDGHFYLDGGLTAMIPIERALKQKCDRYLIITTKTKDYVRKPSSKLELGMIKHFYGDYPKLCEHVLNRSDYYYHERGIVDELVSENKAMHLFPTDNCGVTRFGGTQQQFEELYQRGYQDMEDRKEEILSFLKGE